MRYLVVSAVLLAAISLVGVVVADSVMSDYASDKPSDDASFAPCLDGLDPGREPTPAEVGAFFKCSHDGPVPVGQMYAWTRSEIGRSANPEKLGQMLEATDHACQNGVVTPVMISNFRKMHPRIAALATPDRMVCCLWSEDWRLAQDDAIGQVQTVLWVRNDRVIMSAVNQLPPPENAR